jgi:hypothetical protein
MRSNVDIGVLLNEPSITNRKKIYSDFGGGYATFDKFNDVFTDLTKNYEAYVITSDSTDRNNPDDKVHFYKARMDWEFMLAIVMLFSTTQCTMKHHTMKHQWTST